MPTLKALQVLELYMCLDREEKDRFNAEFQQIHKTVKPSRQMSKEEIQEIELEEEIRLGIIKHFENSARRHQEKEQQKNKGNLKQ